MIVEPERLGKVVRELVSVNFSNRRRRRLDRASALIENDHQANLRQAIVVRLYRVKHEVVIFGVGVRYKARRLGLVIEHQHLRRIGAVAELSGVHDKSKVLSVERADAAL